MADTEKLARRAFLGTLTASIAGTATLAAGSALVPSLPIEAEQVASSNDSESKGYQRTAHIDTYYHLADF